MSEARESERASFKGSLPLFLRTLDKGGTKRGGKGSGAKMERGKEEEEKRKRNCRATRVSR